ncbi:hypothetical protein [Woodsholea maritima]|uniref:hypothetical protein n=1 Tax=Woodsholea maritima TaxID=240237 RepID=UPI000363B916|nr:hypothetical protein [Woodsholea maritima]
MTSEVMIMNRQAIALAADSAVTYGGGTDSVVTLEAEKILTLSPTIALMVYSRGDVLGRSWSQIAHAFRKEYGDQDYASVEECAATFFAFIDNNRRLFPEDDEREEFEDLLRAAFSTVLDYAKGLRNYPHSPYASDESAFEAALDMYRRMLALDEGGEVRDTLAVFEDFTQEDFNGLYGALIDALIIEALGIYGEDEAVRAKLYDFAYMLMVKPAFLETYAGLVFAGFGQDDIFPVYSHYYASILVNGVMKRGHDETIHVAVDDGPSAFVRTFAQADMTHAFLRGVHPTMFDLMISLNMRANEIAAEVALTEAGLSRDQVVEVMGRMQDHVLPELSMEFIRVSQAVSQEEFIDPFIKVVSASGKRQIAETAKSLVDLNILKTNLHMVQTGVGGDVDVVMISRTHGVEWFAQKS